MAAVMVANFSNFLFNAILGRVLTLNEFSILTLVSTLWLQVSILLNALSYTVNNKTAYISAKEGKGIARNFTIYILRKTQKITAFAILAWIIAVPLFSFLFHTNNYLLFVCLAAAFIFGVYSVVNRGYFQGTLSFTKAAVILLTESVSKLIFALLFISFNLKNDSYLSIPLSVFCAFVVAYILVRTEDKKKIAVKDFRFPARLLFATFLTLSSSAAFISIDLLLARIFLSSRLSGEYSLLSLVGKMVFFFGSILNVFILTLASRDAGLKRNTESNFYKILSAVVFLLFIACMVLGMLGDFVVPLLFGQKSVEILPFLLPYTLGIAFFTIGTAFTTYHLAKQEFIFAYNAIFASVILVLGIIIWHGSIGSFVWVIVSTASLYLLTTVSMHLSWRNILYDVDKDVINDMKKFIASFRKTYSVSVCVPAYNEGRNIGNLLERLFAQKEYGFKIREIVVASDGSTDNTIKILNKFKKKGVQIINGRNNKGQTYRQNEIISKTRSDILVLLNADLFLGDNDVIARLVYPILKGADLSAQWAKPAIPKTFLEKVLHAGFEFKYYIYKNYKKGNNIYTCVGHMRALSKRFYSTVHFPPESEGEDQFLYFLCVSRGLKYEYSPSVSSYFKLPASFSDYKKYARRIFQTQTKYGGTFGEKLITKERMLPLSVQFKGIVYGVSKHPLFVPMYIFLHIVIQQWALRQPVHKGGNFEISRSTKSFQ